ncbi:MAG TPA: CoA pyrophosphatase [Cyclobacteriaceae bacterium]
MSFDFLISHLKERLKYPLPGALAHEPMRATPVDGSKLDFKHKLPPRPGSVLILLYEENGVLKFPLIKRPVYSGAHSGQISLPGGKAEEGEDSILTALREGEEEIGINKAHVEVLGSLSEFFVIPSNFIVTPVIGIVRYTPVFVPDSFEVERILNADVSDLLRDSSIMQKEILAAGKYAMMAPHFVIENEIVWGATAMMLNEFRYVLMEIEKQER